MRRSHDKASAALVQDLKQRGLLDDTSSIWAANSAAPPTSQGEITKTSFRPRPPSEVLLTLAAGGGIKEVARSSAKPTTSPQRLEDPVTSTIFHATFLIASASITRSSLIALRDEDYRLTDVAATS